MAAFIVRGGEARPEVSLNDITVIASVHSIGLQVGSARNRILPSGDFRFLSGGFGDFSSFAAADSRPI
jgi:hypothetical protein